jgi:hypothetical protein
MQLCLRSALMVFNQMTRHVMVTGTYLSWSQFSHICFIEDIFKINSCVFVTAMERDEFVVETEFVCSPLFK